MASFSSIVKFGPNNRINGEKYSPGHYVRKAAEMQDAVRQVAADFVQREESLRANPDLTEQGKAREIKKLGADLVARLKEIDAKVLRPLTARRDELTSTLAKLAGKEPSVIDFLREREVRDELRKLDEGTRLTAFTDAVTNGDTVVMQAFFNAPPIAPLVSDRVLQEGKRLWTEKTNPEAAAELADHRFAAEVLGENINDVMFHISEATGAEDTSMRARLEKLYPTPA